MRTDEAVEDCEVNARHPMEAVGVGSRVSSSVGLRRGEAERGSWGRKEGWVPLLDVRDADRTADRPFRRPNAGLSRSPPPVLTGGGGGGATPDAALPCPPFGEDRCPTDVFPAERKELRCEEEVEEEQGPPSPFRLSFSFPCPPLLSTSFSPMRRSFAVHFSSLATASSAERKEEKDGEREWRRRVVVVAEPTGRAPPWPSTACPSGSRRSAFRSRSCIATS